MFESRISAGALEKLPEARAPGKPETNTVPSWSCDMEGHAKKCVERYCELANKTTEQLKKVATPCLDDHHFQEEEENGSVGKFSTVCSQIVLKCLYLARIGRLDILWSVNKFARAVTRLTKACDTRSARLISYIHHTSQFKQYCYVGNTAQPCRIGLLPDSDFAGRVQTKTMARHAMGCGQCSDIGASRKRNQFDDWWRQAPLKGKTIFAHGFTLTESASNIAQQCRRKADPHFKSMLRPTM